MVTLGIDEVGRGCLAGPLVIGAVVLDQAIPGLKDSKLLTKLQRKSLVQEIKLWAKDYSLGWVTAKEVDKLGLTKATALAVNRAMADLTANYDEIITDGNINFLPENPKSRTLIKADNLIPAVSAASILAKVARDNYMINIARTYPDYGFDKHVGYGTKYHLKQLELCGPCELHRRSFKPLSDRVAVL